MLNYFKRWRQKSFSVELPDINTYPTDKNFKLANTADVLSVIDRYCEENHHQITYLSVDPTVFRLDGRDTYQAELILGRGRYQSGYYIHCTQMIS